MKRTKYEYQIIRFMPDRVSEEFVNVGVVMYQKNQRFLQSEVIDKYGRITHFFEEVNGSYLLQTLKHINVALNKIGMQNKTEVPFDLPESLDAITNKILPKDDSALYFTEVNYGVDLNLEKAFDKLTKRYIHDPTDTSSSYTDREVWTKIYKPFFDKHGLVNKLHEKTIKTTTDKIKFDYAYKNGHWNCMETANFELKLKDSIESKVFKIIGKLDALSNSNEELEYHILAHLKSNDKKISNYIKQKLQNHKLGNATINLVTEEDIPNFINRVKKDLHIE